MRLNFRQGLVITQPTFLFYDTQYNHIDLELIVNSSIIATACHKNRDFIIIENGDMVAAWGPMTWNLVWGAQPPTPSITYYLYWDISLATGTITRSFTPRTPVISTFAPGSPLIDQHWFDLTNYIMNVWNGSYWLPTNRVFIGTFKPAGNQITIYSPGSQVGINVQTDAGYILYGTDLRGIKDSQGEFVTTTTPIVTNQGSYTSPLRLELVTPTALAGEVIPAYYCVSSSKNNRVSKASIMTGKRPIGIVDLNYQPGEPVDLIVHGLVFNDLWNWDVNLPQELYCGVDGEILQGPSTNPTVENVRVGIALSDKSALINIDFYGSTGGLGATGPRGPAGVGLQGPAGAMGPTGPMGPGGSNFSFYGHQNGDTVPLTICMPVYSIGGGLIARAKANTYGTSLVMGLISDAQINVGNTGNIQTTEIITALTSQWDLVTNQVGGLTEGSIYYLDPINAGMITTIPPTVSGQYVQIIGKALSITQLSINIQSLVML